MNITSILGFSIAGMVIYFGVLHGAKDPAIFLDPHALMLVLGGTLAATLIAFPMKQIKDLFQFLTYGVFLKSRAKPLTVISDIRTASHNIKMNIRVEESSHAIHPFLLEGLLLLQKNYLTREQLLEVMTSRQLAFKKKYQQDAKVLNSIAKYPPAFGLLGASTGMIAMMTNLGGPGGTAMIGAAMAVALVATFWGIAAANFIILPLADYAQRVIQTDQSIRDIITEGVLMIYDKCPDGVLAERLRSRLELDDRYKIQRSELQVVPPMPSQDVSEDTVYAPQPSAPVYRHKKGG